MNHNVSDMCRMDEKLNKLSTLIPKCKYMIYSSINYLKSVLSISNVIRQIFFQNLLFLIFVFFSPFSAYLPRQW
jgi:hypothetical protein